MRYTAGGWDGGVFDGYANLSQFTIGANTFQINYADGIAGSNFGGGDASGSYLTITSVAVPEASAFFYGGLIVSGICAWKWRQKRRQDEVLA